MRIDQVAWLIFFRHLHKFIRNNNAYRKRLDTYFLIDIDFLTIQEFFDVGVEDIEVNRSCTWALPQLVGIGERVFHDFHDRKDTTGTTIHTFDGFSTRPDFGDVKRDPSTDRR